MGTNFYLFTQKKEYRDIFGVKVEIVDEPDFGYSLHIAKTSCGWLPLFEAHENIRSVKDIKTVFDTGNIRIIDEEGEEYNWEEFEKRVLEFNGGTVKNRKIQKIDETSSVCDLNFPNYTPISHFEYKGITQDSNVLQDYFKDDEDYEFCKAWFR